MKEYIIGTDYNLSSEGANNLNTQVFLNANQQVIAELLTFIDFADDKLTIGFVEINFTQDRERLIDIIISHIKNQEIQFIILDVSNLEVCYLLDVIVAKLANLKIEKDKKLVLLIIGLENSIGRYDEYPPVLQDLNFVRDAYTVSVPHPILFILPDYALTRLAKYAPDFWAWRRGVFRFFAIESVSP
ncbi:hypothetical protein NIES4071_18120 [Calothrix sp. NIES-4071]|nr:hypothetical protein NIES4071_18120 [Calothrix sp. NIES-4071]BAZ56145.1 hypothetical protein NIES4105_18070 [Calothrix sp. NIES-4105]